MRREVIKSEPKPRIDIYWKTITLFGKEKGHDMAVERAIEHIDDNVFPWNDYLWNMVAHGHLGMPKLMPYPTKHTLESQDDWLLVVSYEICIAIQHKRPKTITILINQSFFDVVRCILRDRRLSYYSDGNRSEITVDMGFVDYSAEPIKIF